MSRRSAELDRSRELLHVLPAQPRSLRPARAAIADWLAQLRWPIEDVDDLVLAVSEAVTNVIEHAYPAGRPGLFGLHARCGVGSAPATRRVTVAITDHGTWGREDRVVSPAGRRGHGLTVMSACTAKTEVIRSANGTTVTLTSRDVPDLHIGNTASR
jgi:anti-sigma regulatory factor (Ser/Thr protein kinase)